MFIADLHIHSKYSRATSRECVPEILELWARRKGLGLIGTGDFTHAGWRQELRDKLTPAEEGLYMLKDTYRQEDGPSGAEARPRFVVSGEISSIYKKNGRVRKVHNLIILPGLEAAEALSRRLEDLGGNLHSDGRPILGLDSRDLLEIALETCPQVVFIPAHIWTPHFSVFGAYSGFDDIRECYEDLTEHIYALETGLSSDPPMNWRLSALDKYTLVSNSDAHSPANLAREANLFNTGLSYPEMAAALQEREGDRFGGTLEFFPEEGKYHFDGHRNCRVCWKPADTRAADGLCPVCGGKITVGVLHRVEVLADRPEGFNLPSARPFESLVPLPEVIAASIGLTPISHRVKEKYTELILSLGPELYILREAPLEEINRQAGPLIAEGIHRLRTRRVEVFPGYDGEYGKVRILDQAEIERISGQLGFFGRPDKTGGSGKKARGRAKTAAPQPEPDPDREAETAAIAAAGSAAPDAGSAGTPKSADAAASHSGAARQPDALTVAALDGLNPEQIAAVTALDPVIAVMAGPGTGKTRTLVSRVDWLIRQNGVAPAAITAVTFTHKAAAEMRRRLTGQLAPAASLSDLHIGTFHSLCLRRLSAGQPVSAVRVIDEFEARAVVEDILKSRRIKKAAGDYLRGISLIKSGAELPPDTPEETTEICELYRAQLARAGVLDYDDILLNTLEREENGAAGEFPAGQFTHLLVDEFQDINPVQYRLIQAWSKNSAGLFVIGDPDQSIYAFRGSDARCFERLNQDYATLKTIYLTRNYRSTPPILHCAGEVIAAQPGDRRERGLTACRAGGSPVRRLSAADETEEAIFVAKEINRLVGGLDMLDAHSGAAPAPQNAAARGFADIAVLYRTNHQAEVLEQCLQREGIPYMVTAREDYLSVREVRHCLGFLRFLLDPADLVSLRLFLKTRPDFPAALVPRVIEEYTAAEKSLTALDGVLRIYTPTAAPAGAPPLAALLEKYGPLVSTTAPLALVEAWIEDNSLQGLRAMEQLANAAVLYSSLPPFLENLLLGREGDVKRSGSRRYQPDAVSLMTLHGAKGLEFPVVFLCGVKQGLIPLQNRAGRSDPAEERRLFYVGLTRARDELVVLSPGAPSPFLSALSGTEVITGRVFEDKPAAPFRQLSLFGSARATGGKSRARGASSGQSTGAPGLDPPVQD